MLESMHVLAQNSRREFLASLPASPEMVHTLTEAAKEKLGALLTLETVVRL
jgi:hypothetical protein